MPKKRVAIVGGGITGTTALHVLSTTERFNGSIEVTLFDQGQRGVGGRTSHRRVDTVGQKVVPDDGALAATEGAAFDSFDHGCQFFFAGDARFRERVASWVEADVVKDWSERNPLRVAASSSPPSSPANRDFFGILEHSAEPCYTGVGGMHRVARHQAAEAAAAGAVVNSGTRVARIERFAGDGGSTAATTAGAAAPPQWELFGVAGTAAFHDTAEDSAAAAAAAAGRGSLGVFDAVVFTDASSSYEEWHRASAGVSRLVPDMAAFIRARPRIPLFTAMLTLRAGGALAQLPHGCLVFEEGPVWYACRSRSKPGFACDRECWTLVSTPAFACDEIAEVPMVAVAAAPAASGGGGGVEGADTKTSTVFRPQENGYLNGAGGPAQALADAFLRALTKQLAAAAAAEAGGAGAAGPATPAPELLYLQGQRWGSAIPGTLRPAGQDSGAGAGAGAEAGSGQGADTSEIGGTVYQRTIPDLAVKISAGGGAAGPHEAPPASRDFLQDDALRLYYAGDFCSTRVPGVEAAALSGEDCALCVASALTGRL
jgi:predicted NAD/FAD-dependent oxidoreductase